MLRIVKNIGAVIGWAFNRVVKLAGNVLSLCICCVQPVKKGCVMCWAYSFKQYSCNPRYLTEYLLEHNPEFEVYWVFRNKVDVSDIDKRVKVVHYGSWRYYLLVNTAEFLVTNARTDPWRIYWHKRPQQKYIMLWHGGVALKRIEQDVEKELGFSYVMKAKRDSRACDLMVSGCRMQSELLKHKFWYNGEVLECGVPRNDIFFQTERHAVLRKKVCEQYHIPDGNRIVLYAPTFRRNHSLDPYRVGWEKVLPHLSRFYGGENVTLLLRLHPNLLNKVDVSSLIEGKGVIDVTKYHDMQELLCISDMLITDYSSSMFDFGMLIRPCLLYATDAEQYDRGYYFDIANLPFPLSRNEQGLIDAICTFDSEKYAENLQTFFAEEVGLMEKGDACKMLVHWMLEHQIDA